MNKANMKNQIKQILILQAVVIIYTFSSVAAKFASKFPLMSILFFTCYGIEIFILFIYALLWQQVIKKFDLSVAYANRAMALLWSLIWAVLFFHESISIQNIIGVFIVIAGIVVVNIHEH